MPTNKKEGTIFTTLMCFLMVLGMSAYNLLIHKHFTFSSLFIGLIPGFVAAFILDVFVVGVYAKKLAFKLPINREKKWQAIIAISSLMVLGMVTFMSMFGVIMEIGITSHILADYLTAWRMNFITALPLQLLIVGPFSRMVLQKVQTNAKAAIS